MNPPLAGTPVGAVYGHSTTRRLAAPVQGELTRPLLAAPIGHIACAYHRPGRIVLSVGAAAELDEAATVVLVEGISDQRAVQALADRAGRDLRAEGILVLAMGGATNIGRHVQELGPAGRNVKLAGLCDEAEMPFFRTALERAGLGPAQTREELAGQRFFVCSSDLEDELIRALGVPVVEQVLAQHTDLRSFRIFQQQPDQRGKPDHARLRRFMGTRGGRKIEYASLLVQALTVDRIPRPLAMLMASI